VQKPKKNLNRRQQR